MISRFLLSRALPAVVAGFCVPALLEAQDDAAPPPAPLTDINVILKTTKGPIEIRLLATKAPVTCANFLNLAGQGYYDGVIFHRVDPGFVIQGGDPSGTGRGGPGYFIENEIDPELKHDGPGVVSMARKSEPDTNGSQFFITLGEAPHLDGQYSIFGKVTAGMDVAGQIQKGDSIEDIEIVDSAGPLFARMSARIKEWNQKLEARAKAMAEAEEKAASGSAGQQ